MTRKEMRDRALLALNDSLMAPVFWELSEIDAAIHEGMEIAGEEIRAFRRTVVIPKRPGVAFYDVLALEPQCYAVYRVWDMEREERLTPITMEQLDRHRQRWLTVQSNWPEYWYPMSWGRFGIFPSGGEGGGRLRVDCLIWPEALEADSSRPESPEADHDAYVDYAIYLGLVRHNELQRSLERYQSVVALWKDAQARNEIRRVQIRPTSRNSWNSRPTHYFNRG